MWLTDIFLRFVHFVLALKAAFNVFVEKVTKPLSIEYYQNSSSVLRSDRKGLSRIPLHVGIVVVEDEDISLIDLAKIAVWSMALGVSCVSIYDHAGYCKQQRHKFKEVLTQQQKRILGHEEGSYDIHLHTDGYKGLNNCSRHKSSIDVLLLSPDDGRQNLVTTARHLCRQVHCGQLDLPSITPSYVDSIVKAHYGIPDPDLLLKCGAVDSLLGYMPWEIRLSQIVSLPPHQNLDYKSFREAIQTFGSTNQRFGK